ncbi:class I SAM-dependent methyltransferase [Geodermatophilus sabuli]|uniref:Class I SAM-dependent methyltransferase n=1 Tax=Geodermatophilus sabuli TaxID=1564158 RepID=A0A7K3W8Y4_9ACTN|nr:class I SAM-dependent methyltransferase [Geodermatophilus sabuli]NEK60664.1 class I SAM-dependent methyltransferase [Geodermatophilus sabuli]
MAAASNRLSWAAGIVEPRPGERVLEVGCGHGVLVGLLAERAGEVLGVDRSATMVAAATRRNRAALDAGRVRLAAATLREADLGELPFDAVVAVNVRAFWDADADGTWDVVSRVLAPGGRVVVAFSVMGPGADRPVVAAVTRLAGRRGLDVRAVHRGATTPMESVAVELARGDR